MTPEEKIEKLQQELDTLRSEIKNKKEVKEWNWVPKLREIYWSTPGSINSESLWEDDNVDRCRLSTGDCFKTREEAQEYLEYLTVLQELRVFAREKNKGFKPFSESINISYNIFMEMHAHELQVFTTKYYNTSGVFFIIKKDAEEAINHFGDRLKILFTYNL